MSKSQMSMPSFVGQSSPPICYPAKTDKNANQQMMLCGCRKAPRSQFISAIGVLILVLVYTMIGTIIFVSLESDLDEMDGIETAASKPYPRNENDVIYAELRTRTVNQLWSITEDLNVLYKDNWTRLAAQEVKQFQETILQALKIEKLSRAQHTQTVKQPLTSYRWSYASAFLYSLTLITTIGYGGITPKSQWGRLGELENEFIASNTIIVSYHSLSAALLYALFGIPIILLYLSTMGEGLASGMRCIFKRLRASSSKRNSSSTSNSTSSSTTTPSSSTSNNNLDETMNNTKKNLVGESRQYGNWNHSSTSSLQKHFHNPSLHGYNNNYLASSMVTGNHHKTEKQSAVPIYICIMILICYVTSGAALFHELQKWGVLESLYFCFTALSTIGFGDLLPKDEMGMYVASAYILVGMAVVAMCFSLIQTELIIWLRKFAIQEQSKDDEIALVNVTITPIKS